MRQRELQLKNLVSLYLVPPFKREHFKINKMIINL